jgi:hypothetical protein
METIRRQHLAGCEYTVLDARNPGSGIDRTMKRLEENGMRLPMRLSCKRPIGGRLSDVDGM